MNRRDFLKRTSMTALLATGGVDGTIEGIRRVYVNGTKY